MQREVDYLVNRLGPGQVYGDNVSEVTRGIVYHIPRVRDRKQLQRLVNAMFNSKIWHIPALDILELYEVTQAIFRWKLKISEPSISIKDFYDTWNNAFYSIRTWTLPQLAILSGVLSTKTEFLSVQQQYFIDDSSSCARMYDDWMAKHFLPVWTVMLEKYKSLPPKFEQLVLMYAPLRNKRSGVGINSGNVIQCLFNLVIKYITSKDDSSFVGRHLNDIAFVLNALVSDGSQAVLSSILHQLCQVSYDLSLKELTRQETVRYDVKYYANIMFTFVLILDGCLHNKARIPGLHHQAIMILFYINFIVQDFGKEEFHSYQRVYQVSASILAHNVDIMNASLQVLLGNIWKTDTKANTSRIIFMLEFLETTLLHIPINSQYIDKVLQPIIMSYIHSTNSIVRENAHAVQLSIFQSPNTSETPIAWKSISLKPYLELILTQFASNLVSKEQLLTVYETINSQLPYISIKYPGIVEELLQFTFSKVRDCSKIPTKVVLSECLILQCGALSGDGICKWLDTCQELITQLPQPGQLELKWKMWELVKKSRNDAAIQWWYTHDIHVRL
ncbi:HBR176Cp [Eremothecium sinecaudum]|uniref:HBR176Cp n=1 Tax=Eremothecium sinecaudum TaxID=45286 RepID=A0A109UXE4_9SACH|nr:HBR176Cp [Eremothecium sinecaudum]AMD19077.1 HBR176Cp [Eremothecium sinecaudum]